jgi:hypothetical protein
LALSVVVSAGEADKGGAFAVGYDLLNQPTAGSDKDQLANFWNVFGQR